MKLLYWLSIIAIAFSLVWAIITAPARFEEVAANRCHVWGYTDDCKTKLPQ